MSPEAPPAAEARLGGVWALELAIVTENQVPVLGGLRSTSRTWARVALAPAGSGWEGEHVVCAVDVRAPVARMEVPPAYVAAVAPKRNPVAWTAEADGFRFDADTLPFRMGYDPECAAVPQAADDPCVVDAEGDGHPGATVRARAPLFSTVDVYVAQRSHAVLHGRTVAAGRVEGPIEVRALESRVLGASNPLFASSPRSTLVPDATRFTMVRLGDDADCAAVIAAFRAP